MPLFKGNERKRLGSLSKPGFKINLKAEKLDVKSKKQNFKRLATIASPSIKQGEFKSQLKQRKMSVNKLFDNLNSQPKDSSFL